MLQLSKAADLSSRRVKICVALQSLSQTLKTPASKSHTVPRGSAGLVLLPLENRERGFQGHVWVPSGPGPPDWSSAPDGSPGACSAALAPHPHPGQTWIAPRRISSPSDRKQAHANHLGQSEAETGVWDKRPCHPQGPAPRRGPGGLASQDSEAQ